MSIQYIISAWFGKRRREDKRYEHDRTFYLREHFRSLTSLKHNIDKIVVVCQRHQTPFQYPYAFMDIWNDFKRSAPCETELLHRDNLSGSYGGYIHAWNRDRRRFNAHIIMEDDYVFALDNFDERLSNIQQITKAGYVCGSINVNILGERAQCTNGLITNTSFHVAYRRILIALKKCPDIYKVSLQSFWSQAFSFQGIHFAAMTRDYSIQFQRMLGRIELLGNPENKLIMRPI